MEGDFFTVFHHEVDAGKPRHIRRLMRIRNHGKRSLAHRCFGKTHRRKERAFHMNVSINETGQDERAVDAVSRHDPVDPPALHPEFTGDEAPVLQIDDDPCEPVRVLVHVLLR